MSRRRKRPRGAPRVEREAFAVPGIEVVRNGRHISVQTHFDEQEHERFTSGWLARIPEIQERREQRLQRLGDVLTAAGPAACVAYASLTYLRKDPNTYRESEDDRSSAHVEFLALRALPFLDVPTTVDEHVLPTLADEALQLVRDAFDDTRELVTLRSVQAIRRPGASETFEEYRRHALLEALSVRGSAYQEHTKLILEGCFAPFGAECKAHLGFTAAQAWRLVYAVAEVVGSRVEPRLRAAAESYRDSAKGLRWLRRKGMLSADIARYPPSQQRRATKQLALHDALRDPVALALLTAGDLAAVTGIEETACEAWLQTMHCPPSEYIDAHHRAPAGGHPITRRPLLKLADGYLAPAPMALNEALRPRMEDALREAVPAAWSRYEAWRGR